MKPTIFYILLFGIILGCKSSQQNIQVNRPADIVIPPHIKSIAIVDRTMIDKSNRAWKTFEGITSGEKLNQDRQAEQFALSGLNEILLSSTSVSAKLTGIQLIGARTTSQFPTPIDSAEIAKICDQYNTDAVAALEIFDSDCSGRIVVIKMGFRLYDRKNKSIADQHYYTFQSKWKRSHSLTNTTLQNKYSESNAINQAAYDGGVKYGQRISNTMMNIIKK